jgi:hypothetical protein
MFCWVGMLQRQLYPSDLHLRQGYGSGGNLVNGVDEGENILMNENDSRCSQSAED